MLDEDEFYYPKPKKITAIAMHNHCSPEVKQFVYIKGDKLIAVCMYAKDVQEATLEHGDLDLRQAEENPQDSDPAAAEQHDSIGEAGQDERSDDRGV